MELNQTTFKDSVFGAESEMSFSIDDNNSIIFDILRDKMYSNKIGSLCREVASNSRDANREAGMNDTPIEIEIINPDKLAFISDMCVVFRDYGIGITPDRMMNVFVKYASSTKRSSNAQTGGFGLGAKTPFAYTDTFSVVTICDYEGSRKKYTYTAMIDSSRKGKMILFDCEETDQSTGTQIIVPIQEKDRGTFERECLYSTCLWEVQPKMINFNINQYVIDKIIDQPTFSIVKDDDDECRLGDEGYFVNIDGICYKIDRGALKIRDQGINDGYKVIAKFNVGELTISANREALQYDEQTSEKIKATFNDAKHHLLDLLSEQISSSQTYLAACEALSSIIGKRGNSIEEGRDDLKVISSAIGDRHSSTILGEIDSEQVKSRIKWNGRSLTNRLVLNAHSIAYVREPLNEKVNYDTLTNNHINRLLTDSPIYYLDTRKNVRRNITIWNNRPKSQKGFILIIPNSKATRDQLLDDGIKLSVDYDIDVKMYSDVEKAENNTISGSAYTPSETVTIRTRTDDSAYLHRKYEWSTSRSIDLHREKMQFWDVSNQKALDEKFAYLVVDQLSDTSRLNTSLIRDKIKLIKSIDKRTVVLINKTTQSRYADKITDFVEVSERGDQLIKKYRKQLNQAKLFEKLNVIVSAIPELMREEFVKLYPKTVQDFVQRSSEGEQQEFPLLETLEVKFDFKGLKDKIQASLDKYPMLESYVDAHLRGYHWRTTLHTEKLNHSKVIKNYIELVG